MTSSEKIVVSLCRKAFLSLWTMANPIGKKPGKELCDALIVFENDIIVISVKEIIYKQTEDILTGWNRWNKTAVEKSIKQLKGAKRYLESQTSIESKENNVVFDLPDSKIRKYHLLTISLGSKREIPISIPINNDEFIHFIDEYCLDIIFNELDTAADFIEYLENKEKIFKENNKILLGAEEDLLGYYLWHNRTFPSEYDCISFLNDIWENIRNEPDFLQKKVDDKISYFWDGIIEEFINKRDPKLNAIFGSFDKSNENIELALRVLAKESRFSRRILSQAFWDFHKNKSIVSRAIQSPQSNVFYIFMKKPIDFDRKARQIELLARCIIIRDKVNYNATIIGLATEDNIIKGHSFDLLFYKKENWTDEDKNIAKSAIDDLDLFKSPKESIVHADEYRNKKTTT